MKANNIKIQLTSKERDLVLDYGFLLDNLESYLRELPIIEGDVYANLSKTDLETLLGDLSAETNYVKSRKLALSLNNICEKIEARLTPRTYITSF